MSYTQSLSMDLMNLMMNWDCDQFICIFWMVSGSSLQNFHPRNWPSIVPFFHCSLLPFSCNYTFKKINSTNLIFNWFFWNYLYLFLAIFSRNPWRSCILMHPWKWTHRLLFIFLDWIKKKCSFLIASFIFVP